VFDAARLTIDDIQHIDLYACFPAPPQLAAEALGVAVDDTRRPLTCTGGLAFAGGPGNNYMTHVVANIVERLRADSGAHALAAGVGWYATTHSIGVYGTEPPGDGFRRIDAQAAVDNTPRRAVAEAYDGPATLETFTVTHGRDGEREMAFAAALTLDGARVWASSTDSDVMLALETGELLGSPVEIKEGSLRC
jgi:acetyl-CoA C-acetyltransferase